MKGKQSQHVKISHGEKLNPCNLNQVVKHPLKKMLWGCFSLWCGITCSCRWDDELRQILGCDPEKSDSTHERNLSWRWGDIFSKILLLAMHQKSEEIFQETEWKRFTMDWQFTWSLSNRIFTVNYKISFAKTGL